MRKTCQIIPVTLFAAMLSACAEPPIGVIVAKSSDRVTPGEWRQMETLQCLPELLSRYTAETPGATFDFVGLREDLAAFEAHGLPVSLTLTAHLHTTPYRAMRDENGKSYQQRHNPFDPAFLGEWGRLHQAFLDEFAHDSRIRRVYVAPPSYFGESEYYMGPDWAHLHFLAYDDLARRSFTAWLRGRYENVEALSKAWGIPVAAWDAVPLPKPRRDGPSVHAAPDWLDFMTWRTDHLTDMIATEMARLAAGFHGEVGMKAAVGDFSAAHGVNTADILARFPKEGRLALHATNGHSLSDLKYFSAIADHYGAASFIIENDGNRFTRTELARLLLNYLLAGADTFNFAHLGHFTLGPPTRSTSETYRVLRSLRPWLTRYDLTRQRNPVAFLHGNATAWVRAPGYRNRDVSRAYDAALANGAGPEVRAYSWARWLGVPDVTCERRVLEGDLAGRRMLIIPNSSVTVLPAAVRDRILAWVADGGTLVLFGADSLGRVLVEKPTRCLPVESWVFPEVVQGAVPLTTAPWLRHVPFPKNASFPVFRDAPDPAWRPVLTDGKGRSALVSCAVGAGVVYLFPGVIPELRDGPYEAFYARAVPRLLYAMAKKAGVDFAVEMVSGGRPVAPLALSYLGVDGKSGRHIFVGGAYDGSTSRMTLVPDAGLSGPAELLLVDEPRVAARAERGKTTVTCNRPVTGTVYEDPTNTEARLGAYIPCTTVTFVLPNRLEVALVPSL